MDSPTPDQQPARPWYKEPWPWFLFGIPGLTVVAGFTTLFIAINQPNQLLSSTTADAKKQAYRTMTAQEREIEGQLAFNRDGKLYAAFTAKHPMEDQSISVQLYRIKDASEVGTSLPVNHGENNVSRRRASGAQILALELQRQTNGSYLSDKALSVLQRESNFWLEIVGERAAWSLTGTLLAGDKALVGAN